MSEINDVVDLSIEASIAVITTAAPPVNALSQAVREGLHSALRQAFADSTCHAVVVICEGRTFFAGADIREMDRPVEWPSLREFQALLDGARKPVIAAIHGTALGGGLELAMMCHYRVAVPSARCGLPEVNIGILPGAGGTQALPRLVGVEPALEMMTSGRHVPAVEAHALGLLDELVPESELRSAAIAFALRSVAAKPISRVRDRTEKIAEARNRPDLVSTFREANARKLRNQAAPESILECVQASIDLPFDEGLRLEAALSTKLHDGPQAPAMRYAFFAERMAAHIPDVPDDAPVLRVNTVGVIGAGTMGGGIAMNFANAGIPVTLVETRQAALEHGLSVIRGNYERTARRGGISQGDVEDRMTLIRGTLDMTELGDVDLVLEAVFEEMEVKKQIFARLDAICKQGAVLATNTSGLDIDEIAGVTKRPDAVIGLHFFSPANVMKLIEVVRADRTAKPVINTAMKLAKRLGKVPVLVGVCPGFVGNRILHRREVEAQHLILEGAMPWDVDRALYDFGFPMGPFAMNDLAGLDIGWVREASKGETTRDVLCELDRRGQKTGAGYYDYDANRNPTPSPVTERIIGDFMSRAGINGRQISDTEIVERCLYPMIDEAVQILAERKAIRPSDVDVIWLYGYGFPRHRGGLLYYGDQVGPDKVLAKLREFQAAMGDRFKPSSLLEKLVAEQRSFADIRDGA